MVILDETTVQEFLSSEPTPDTVQALTVAELKVLCLHLGAQERDLHAARKPRLVEIVCGFLFELSAGDSADEEQGKQQAMDANMPGGEMLAADLETPRVSLPLPGAQLHSTVRTAVDAAQPPPTPPPLTTNTDFSQQMELLKMQLELQNAKAREEELKIRRIEAETTLRATSAHLEATNPLSAPFDLAKAGKFVPVFDEKDPDLFFSSFERVARQLAWPEEFWTLLVQPRFVGRGRRTYLSLSDSTAQDYDAVKAAVLRAHALVPDAYRCKFRALKKNPDVTHLEYARLTREAFTRWLRATQTESFENLVELILLEKFITSVSREVGVHIVEKQVKTLEEAAQVADNFDLAHRSFKAHSGTGTDTTKSTQGKWHKKKTSNKTERDKGDSPSSPSSLGKSKPQCSYCKRPGHTFEKCFKRISVKAPVGKAKTTLTVGAEENDKEDKDTDKPVALVSNFSVPLAGDIVTEELKSCAPVKVGRETNPFLSSGFVEAGGKSVPVTVLRDTGAMQSLIRDNVVGGTGTGRRVLLRGIVSQASVPLRRYLLHTDCFSGPADLAVFKDLPVSGVDVILGNDLGGSKVTSEVPLAILEINPLIDPETVAGDEPSSVFPACAVTRSMSRQSTPPSDPTDSSSSPGILNEDPPDDLGLVPLFQSSVDSHLGSNSFAGREALIEAQRDDPTLQPLLEEANDSTGDSSNAHFYLHDGVLFRRWMPRHLPQDDAEWSSTRQLVVPQQYRHAIIQLSHAHRFSAHYGARNTLNKLLKVFYWPRMRKEVFDFVKSCHVCQKAGKPVKRIPPAPLYKVPPVGVPFSHIQVDIVGPLPRTKRGHEYIVTMLDVATRFVHGVPLRAVSAKAVVRSLTDFFSMFGVPTQVQTDGASYFTGTVFTTFLHKLGITHSVSSPYHPESQGALERSHRSIKSSLTKLGLDSGSSWDDDLAFALFALRDTPNASHGFTPFELVFGHSVRGPLCILRDKLLEKEPADVSALELVEEMRQRLTKCWNVAADNLEITRDKTKQRYDLKARYREFRPGQQVLIFLPLQGQPLSAKFSGPYQVLKKISDTTYVVATPDRRRTQRLCHVNSMKLYHEEAQGSAQPALPCSSTSSEDEDNLPEADTTDFSSVGVWKQNPEVFCRLTEKLTHLEPNQQADIHRLLSRYSSVMRDQPGRTPLVVHDICVGDAKPIKQVPYRVNPEQRAVLSREIASMLDMGLIKEDHSPWSSPVVLVKKPDGSSRVCVDYRRVNKLVAPDSYPLPRLEDCIEAVGRAKYISKFDLLKGFFQIPLTTRAQQIAAFVALGKVYVPLVMPFGLSTAPTAFQALMNKVLSHIPGVTVYIDDIVVYSDTWSQHVSQLDAVFRALAEANLVLNLSKSDFGHAEVTYLGHVVGRGVLAPIRSKVLAIQDLPPPTNRRALRRFLGMIGFYRRFVHNFALIATPLTDLLKGKHKYTWDDRCQLSFDTLKEVLCVDPVLRVPDFSRGYKLACDASDCAVGAVLLQEDETGIDRPVAYFSRKLSPPQTRYSTIEKEALSIVLALQHFQYYTSTSHPTLILTDHKPLTYISTLSKVNRRLMRWALFLQNFNLEFKHVKGKDNVIADCLSRPS